MSRWDDPSSLWSGRGGAIRLSSRNGQLELSPSIFRPLWQEGFVPRMSIPGPTSVSFFGGNPLGYSSPVFPYPVRP